MGSLHQGSRRDPFRRRRVQSQTLLPEGLSSEPTEGKLVLSPRVQAADLISFHAQMRFDPVSRVRRVDALCSRCSLTNMCDSPSLSFILTVRHILKCARASVLANSASKTVYADGNVCISILHSPGDDPNHYELASERWSPVQNVNSILLSVLSMLSGTPISPM